MEQGLLHLHNVMRMDIPIMNNQPLDQYLTMAQIINLAVGLSRRPTSKKTGNASNRHTRKVTST